MLLAVLGTTSRHRRQKNEGPQLSAAHCLHDLMRNVLGYARFGAQGGDYGAFTATRLGVAHPAALVGIHLNFLVVRRDLPVPATPSPEERIYFDDLARFIKMEIGYQQIQGTKPQTLAYGLTDSPAGLAAWLVEKFRTWSDCDGDLESVHSREVIAGEYLLLLVHGRDRLLLLALLRANSPRLADPRREEGDGSDRICRVP